MAKTCSPFLFFESHHLSALQSIFFYDRSSGSLFWSNIFVSFFGSPNKTKTKTNNNNYIQIFYFYQLDGNWLSHVYQKGLMMSLAVLFFVLSLWLMVVVQLHTIVERQYKHATGKKAPPLHLPGASAKRVSFPFCFNKKQKINIQISFFYIFLKIILMSNIFVHIAKWNCSNCSSRTIRKGTFF